MTRRIIFSNNDNELRIYLIPTVGCGTFAEEGKGGRGGTDKHEEMGYVKPITKHT